MAAPSDKAARVISGVDGSHTGAPSARSIPHARCASSARTATTWRRARAAKSISSRPTAPAAPTIIRRRAETSCRRLELLGDIGRLDADGYLYLGDRLADMILRGGANVDPAEVEAAVSAHPKGAPASSSAAGSRVRTAHPRHSRTRRPPTRKRSSTASGPSSPTGSAAPSIRKVSRSSASACATISARSAAR